MSKKTDLVVSREVDCSCLEAGTMLYCFPLLTISVHRKAFWCTVIKQTPSRQLWTKVREISTPTSQLTQSGVRKLSCSKRPQHAGPLEVIKSTSSTEWKDTPCASLRDIYPVRKIFLANA